MAPEQTCGTCRYWRAIDKAQGNCRRFPPMPVAFVLNGGMDLDGASWSPVTSPTEFCGEHKLPDSSPLDKIDPRLREALEGNGLEGGAP